MGISLDQSENVEMTQVVARNMRGNWNHYGSCFYLEKSPFAVIDDFHC